MHKNKSKIFIKILSMIAIISIIILLFKIFKIDILIQKQIYPTKYSEYVDKYSKEYNVDAKMIYSIIKAESNFNEKVKSTSGAIGLMQVMEDTANEIAQKNNIVLQNLYDPETNIKIGTKYYSNLLANYNNNMLLALSAYNAGMGTVNNWISTGTIKKDGSDIENIPYKETNIYVRKIINNYKMYNKIYE